jgi:5-methylcytosine-specific restriction endonuclease McrA
MNSVPHRPGRILGAGLTMSDPSVPAARSRSRPKVPYAVQVRVFFRDAWLCRWCHRPVVFAPTFRLLHRFVERAGYNAPLAYFHPNWRRDAAPLLDHLAAVIDHVAAYSRGGLHDEQNFVTACNKCNARKNSRIAEDYMLERPGHPVRGRFGEPKDWDGLVSVFLTLAVQEPSLQPSERTWDRELRAFLAANRTLAPATQQ